MADNKEIKPPNIIDKTKSLNKNKIECEKEKGLEMEEEMGEVNGKKGRK